MAEMTRQTQAEWLSEMKQRFASSDEAAFVCPRCGGVQTLADFKERGLDPQRAYSDCIGRYLPEQGCDWAAYGLLGTLGKGRLVVAGERELEVFDFAPSAVPTSLSPVAG